VEIGSAGTFPTGITPEMLTRQHLSVLRNPIIADVFHRAGLIERWGRGTNRVIEMCLNAGIAPPVFQESGPFVVVTFRVRVSATPQVEAIIEAARQTVSAEALQAAAGLKDRVHFLRSYLRPLLENGWLERTIPDKPRSRMQRYRTTEAGLAALKDKVGHRGPGGESDGR
jgi:ATP-dependent DNA helicase RecG